MKGRQNSWFDANIGIAGRLLRWECSTTLDQDRLTHISIPEAFLVDNREDEEVIIATPLEPTVSWYQQKRVKFLLDIGNRDHHLGGFGIISIIR